MFYCKDTNILYSYNKRLKNFEVSKKMFGIKELLIISQTGKCTDIIKENKLIKLDGFIESIV